MFCKNCGEQLPDDANVCPKCGTSVRQENSQNEPVVQNQESSAIGILSIVFGALGGFLGLIFGIIGIATYKKPENKKKCYIGIGLFCAWIVIDIILFAVGL